MSRKEGLVLSLQIYFGLQYVHIFTDVVNVNSLILLLLFVVVVMTSPSGWCLYGRQIFQTDEEFHQIIAILEHIFDVNGVCRVLLAFCCLFGQKRNKCSVVSFPFSQC